jgi:diketogulonate reductase-like aldo/keto reductase
MADDLMYKVGEEMVGKIISLLCQREDFFLFSKPSQDLSVHSSLFIAKTTSPK